MLFLMGRQEMKQEYPMAPSMSSLILFVMIIIRQFRCISLIDTTIGLLVSQDTDSLESLNKGRKNYSERERERESIFQDF